MEKNNLLGNTEGHMMMIDNVLKALATPLEVLFADGTDN